MNRPVNRRALKAASAVAMQGSWLRSFLITFLSSLIPMIVLGFLPLRMPVEEELIAAGGDFVKTLALFLPQAITSRTVASFVVTAVIYLLVVCPFNIGTRRFYLAVALGRRGKLSDVLSAFTSLRTVFSSIWLDIIVSVASFLWAVVLIVPPCIFMALGVAINSSPVVVLSTVLLIIVSIIYVLKISIYQFAFYIFAEEKTGGAWKSFRTMQKITRGRTAELMGLRASYFGWDIASACFSALSFVYTALSGTVYAKYLFCLRNEGAEFEPGMEGPFDFSQNTEM
ncbi:MAG: hypothetical protein IJ299_01950 [Oscillospiraceae bacterium]|nr:hypothetical protein [Oscillospiraceae bacterium]